MLKKVLLFLRNLFPDDSLREIFMFLALKDILNNKLINRRFRTIIKDERLWCNLLYLFDCQGLKHV